MSVPNRRKHTRVKPKQLTARIRAGEALHIGLGIENISVGGAFIRCNTALKVGIPVMLEILRGEGSQALGFPGKVTSTVSLAAAAQTGKVAGVGIKFDPLPPHLEAWVGGLVTSNTPAAVAAPQAPGKGPPRLTAAPPASLAPPVVAVPTPVAAVPQPVPSRAPPRSNVAPPPSDERTQSVVPAFVPKEPDPDARQLRSEVQVLRALVEDRDQKLAALENENRKLRAMLAQRR